MKSATHIKESTLRSMVSSTISRTVAAATLLVCLSAGSFAQTAPAKKTVPSAKKAAPKSGSAVRQVLEANVRAEMEALAGDAARGRGSATEDELRAGEYIAGQFKKFGIAPAGDKGANGKPGYIETVTLSKQEFVAPPVLYIGSKGDAAYWEGTHGKEIAVLRTSGPKVSGP